MRRLRKPINSHEFPELYDVLTCAETARYFRVHPKTVMSAINDGRLAALLVGAIWLVSKRSAKKLWGDKRQVKAHPKPSSNVR